MISWPKHTRTYTLTFASVYLEAEQIWALSLKLGRMLGYTKVKIACDFCGRKTKIEHVVNDMSCVQRSMISKPNTHPHLCFCVPWSWVDTSQKLGRMLGHTKVEIACDFCGKRTELECVINDMPFVQQSIILQTKHTPSPMFLCVLKLSRYKPETWQNA